MKSSYDIILYFSWTHSSHIHKYLALKDELNKHANTLLIFDNGKFGATQRQAKVFEAFWDNVIITDLNQATQILFNYNPKILIMGSDKQTLPWQRQVNQQLKSTTIQLPHLVGVDDYYSGTDFFTVLGPIHEIQSFADRRGKVKNKIHVNPWLHDLVENCLPYNLTRKQFCEKYKLNENEDILIWLPNMSLVSGCDEGEETERETLEIYNKICSVDNVIVSVHPNEYRRHKSERIGNKWTYELVSSSRPVLDPIDCHWAYKYCACGISQVSSIGIEFGFFDKPFVYLGKGSPKHWDKAWAVDGKSYFSWVGDECPSHKIEEFFAEKLYKIEDKNLYKQHREKFCVDPNKNFIKFLAEKILLTDIIKK